MDNPNRTTLPSQAALLGYAGVLPFAALALAHLLGGTELRDFALRAFLAYGAVILSFLGGIRWGVATGRPDASPSAAFLVAVLPSLWAFACLSWPDARLAAWGLLLGFAGIGLADRWTPGPGTPAWMIRLRARLSLAVVACHVPVIVPVPVW
jgi:hypothetical protein